jgi:Ser/Thr protein kinase RdoA (MazF antagonist)
VQDLWMLLTGVPAQREALLEGYEQFRPFDRNELALIAPLRLMRQIHYAGWIAERWADPAFPAAFPHVALAPWWEQHCRDIAEALEVL